MDCYNVGVTIVGCEVNEHKELLTAMAEHFDVDESYMDDGKFEVEGTAFIGDVDDWAESLTHAIWSISKHCEVESSVQSRRWETFVFDRDDYDEFNWEEDDDETINLGENDEQLC